MRSKDSSEQYYLKVLCVPKFQFLNHLDIKENRDLTQVSTPVCYGNFSTFSNTNVRISRGFVFFWWSLTLNSFFHEIWLILSAVPTSGFAMHDFLHLQTPVMPSKKVNELTWGHTFSRMKATSSWPQTYSFHLCINGFKDREWERWGWARRNPLVCIEDFTEF